MCDNKGRIGYFFYCFRIGRVIGILEFFGSFNVELFGEYGEIIFFEWTLDFFFGG